MLKKSSYSQHVIYSRLILPIGLALLVLAGLLTGLRAAGAAGGAVRYVDSAGGSDDSDCTSSSDPCESIQYALDQSAAGDEIRVAEGSYAGFGMNFQVAILGGYEAAGWTRDIDANPTIVDGGGTWPGHLVHVDTGADLFLEGFTVQGANPPHDGGGFGVFTATVTISGTIVQNNGADVNGAGLYAHAGDITIVNSTFQNNIAQGGGAAIGTCCGGSLTIMNSAFISNQANWRGGAILNFEADTEITGSSFTGNISGDYGGAISFGGTQNAFLQSVVMNGNQAGSGGALAVQEGSQVVYADGDVSGNFTTGGAGGGIGVWDGFLEMTHVVVQNNTALTQGGGIHLAGPDSGAMIVNALFTGNHADEGLTGTGIDAWGYLALVNSTVADNVCDTPALCAGGVAGRTQDSNLVIWNSILASHPEGDLYCEGACDVTYTDVTDSLWPGNGNLSADPLFVNPGGGDYHLQAGSPAADAGTPYGAPPDDLDGFPRDATPDMGVYELPQPDYDLAMTDLQPTGPVVGSEPVSVHFTLYNSGQNAFSDYEVDCTIEFGGQAYWSQSNSWPNNPLSPLHWLVYQIDTVTFDDPGEYTLVCSAQLNGQADERPGNDTITRTLDVGPAFADAWVKDNPLDDGDVPSNEGDWYQSPDIWVRHADDGGLVHQDPIAEQVNYVYVRLHNRGNAPVSGVVDTTWIEPSLGTRCGDWAPIGSIEYEDLQPGETRIISTPWTPTRSGHTCLQAILDSDDDPYNRDLECTPLWVPWDNNLGWRNINIFDNPSGRSPLDSFTSAVGLVNVYNTPAEVDLIVDRMTFPMSGEMIVEFPQHLFDAWVDNGAQGTGIEQAGGTQIRITGAVSGTVAGIPMGPAERATLDLLFDGPAGLEFEMGLRESIEGQVVGGVGYRWVIPDTTAPSVIDVEPANGAADVDPNTAIVITFDEPVVPDSLDLSLDPMPADEPEVTWNEDNTVATVQYPTLQNGTDYTVSVSAADGSLNEMEAPFEWSFTTGGTVIYLPVIMREP